MSLTLANHYPKSTYAYQIKSHNPAFAPPITVAIAQADSYPWSREAEVHYSGIWPLWRKSSYEPGLLLSRVRIEERKERIFK